MLSPSGKQSFRIHLSDKPNEWSYSVTKKIGQPYNENPVAAWGEETTPLTRQDAQHSITCSPLAIEIEAKGRIRYWCMGFCMLPELLTGYRSYYISILQIHPLKHDVVWSEHISADHPLLLKHNLSITPPSRIVFTHKFYARCQARLHETIANLTLFELSNHSAT
ncbi:hypothetical protein UFOVP736_69 [uncultured Caudovirales phage]|uniref:Uncharacterized protein n=1 Tax=uncultured Caudovirales phage TaxID=2100421 RepID=A0A6J7X5K9_9CAUD|nr:hypothetical protein UFOVP705_12 [uncultured Caudovirales phage]CAB5224397.1 hypothetical protein UFOVP736_69 [uncultured Caudovirales phage]